MNTMSDEFSRRTLHWRIFLLALGAPFLLSLGDAPLFDVDEGAFAQASLEMWVSRDFGHTTLNGADRFDKPMGVYWLQALAIALLGPTEWAVRLPSALCAWALCVGVARFARDQWGRDTGLWAGAVLATSAGLLVIGRASTADALLNLCLGMTALALWRHLESGSVSHLRRAAVWTAMGLLTKGPVAVLLPAAALVLWCLTQWRLDLLRRALADRVSWLLLLGISMPWYVHAWLRHGWAFIEGFLLRHNVERFTAAMEGHAGGGLYFVVILPLLWLPWSALLLPLARHGVATWKDAALRFFLLWAVFCLGFFSLSGTKLPHYALYACVPLALLMARHAAQAGIGLRAGLWLGLGVWWALLTLLPLGAHHLASFSADPWYRSQLLAAPPAAGLVWPIAVVTLGVVAWGLLTSFGGSSRPYALWAGWGASVLCATVSWPWAGEALQGPVRRAALASLHESGTLVQWNVHWPSVGFYRQQDAPRRPPQAGELAVVRLDRLSAAPDLEVLYRERGVALVRRTPDGPRPAP